MTIAEQLDALEKRVEALEADQRQRDGAAARARAILEASGKRPTDPTTTAK
jgi:BMFP domain-containing protein YqiC